MTHQRALIAPAVTDMASFWSQTQAAIKPVLGYGLYGKTE